MEITGTGATLPILLASVSCSGPTSSALGTAYMPVPTEVVESASPAEALDEIYGGATVPEEYRTRLESR